MAGYGLDTRGLADGFVQGFGLMDQYQRGQRADRRAEDYLRVARENAEWQRRHGDRQFGLAERTFDHNVQHSDRQFGLQERQLDHTISHADRQFGLAERQFDHSRQVAARNHQLQRGQLGLAQQRLQAEQEDRQRARDMEELQFTLSKIGAGMDVDDSEMDLLKRYPKFWSALDPATDRSIEQAMAVIDPNTPVDANDPESLAALNQMFGAEINQGDGGQKRVVGMFPAPDGQSVVLELEMTREDGTTYRAPMTEGRGTGEDDLVMYVPVERLVEQVQGMRMLRNTMRTPDAQAQAARVLRLMRGEPANSAMAQDRLDKILDQYTKDQMAIVTDGDIMSPEDRQARLEELDAIYSRNLGVSRDALSLARSFAESKGIPLTPQLLQDAQQDMHRSGLQGGGEDSEPVRESSGRPDPVAAAENRLADQRQRRQEQESRRAIDARMDEIERQLPQQTSGLMVPGGAINLMRGPMSAEEREALLNELREIQDATPRQQARAERLALRLLR